MSERKELSDYFKDCEQYKQVIRQKLRVKFFQDHNQKHVNALNKYLAKIKKVRPSLVEIPYRWYEAFQGWEYLAKFGRPSSMGLQPQGFETIYKYVSLLSIEKKYHLILIDQIITIDIEFVKIHSKKD